MMRTGMVMTALAGSTQAAVIHAVGVDNQTTSSSVTITSWSALGVDGSTSSVTSGPINGVVDGEAFTYTATVTNTGNADNLSLIGVNSLLGAGAVNLGEGDVSDTVTITIAVTSGNVVFDGFTHFSNGNFARSTTDDDVVDVNGTDYSGDSGELEFDLAGSPAASFVYSTELSEGGDESTTTLRYVDFQFSSVPEPSSTALLGLGGFAMMLRRRR